jgi:outer membrane protein TolC
MLPFRLSHRLLVAGGMSLALASAALAQPKDVKPIPPKDVKTLPKDPKAPARDTLPAPGPAAFPTPTPLVTPSADVVTRFTLGEALAIGREKHPQLAALRASMNAALLSQRGLGEVKRMAGFITPDIDYREQQSDIGLKAAMAEYDQAQHEVTYAVTRCYYTVVYTREQEKVAKDLVEQLETNLAQVRKIVEGKGGGVKGVTKDTENRLVVVLGEVKAQLYKAQSGTDRARAALREAMGVDPMYQVDVADEILPEIKADIKRETVVAHAVTRRGEVLLTQLGVDVTRLEACAQWSKKFNLRAPTYSEGADIHARTVPGEQRDPEYKPGAIGPQMPNKLVGRYGTRTDIANQYAVRADAAAAQARSLVALEAEVAHARWVEATKRVASAKEASMNGRELIERQRLAAGGTLSKEDVLLNEVSATKAIASLNEALWEQIIELVNLERITAGGIRVNFPGR